MREPLVSTSPTIARINVTPIIDVALVLVIILLFTAPVLSVANVDLALPEAEARKVEDTEMVSITLGRQGEMAIDDQMIDPRELVNGLRARLVKGHASETLVIVRADASTPHHVVRTIMSEARAAGATRLAVATRLSEGK